MQWHIYNRKRIMIQWGRPIFFSLGIHIDSRLRYVDLHLIFIIITIGNAGKSGDWSYDEYRVWWASRSNGAIEH